MPRFECSKSEPAPEPSTMPSNIVSDEMRWTQLLEYCTSSADEMDSAFGACA